MEQENTENRTYILRAAVATHWPKSLVSESRVPDEDGIYRSREWPTWEFEAESDEAALARARGFLGECTPDSNKSSYDEFFGAALYKVTHRFTPESLALLESTVD